MQPGPDPRPDGAAIRSRRTLAKANAFLHVLSHLAFVFALAGIAYQVQAFLIWNASGEKGRGEFVANLVLALTMWGFFMAFLGFTDHDRMNPRELANTRKRAATLSWVCLFLMFMALLCLALGLFLLLSAGDQLQGVAIICFGTGILGLVRFLIGRLNAARDAASPPVPTAGE